MRTRALLYFVAVLSGEIMILIQKEENLVISLELEGTGEGMLEFRDRYSWNTIPLQIKCCI